MIGKMFKTAKTVFYENVSASKVLLPANRPTISFTFDDAPYSAFEHGAPILEQYGVEGTFYVAGSFDSVPVQEGRRYMTAQDVRLLHARGHQIGCHTYGHHSLRTLTMAESCVDAQRNREFWQQAIGCDLEDFSYPFGEVTLSVKKALKPYYQSLRGNRPGINRGEADMSFLRSVSIYSSTLRKDEIDSRIRDCEARGGWLIFYTHGVGEKAPERFDISVEDFKWVVDRSCNSAARVLNVRKAREYLTGAMEA